MNCNAISIGMSQNSLKCSSPIKLISTALRYDDGIAFVLRNDARTDEPGEARIDFRNFHLPANALSKGCSLDQDTEAVCTVLTVLDKYLYSSSRSKEIHRTAATIAAVVAKLFEYCRLNGVYAPRQLTPDHFRTLAQLIAVGGWCNALQLKDRCEVLLDGEFDPAIIKGKAMVFAKEFKKLLRTSCSGREFSALRPQVARALFGVVTPRNPAIELYTASLLRQIFGVINTLSTIDDSLAIPFTPYPDMERLANSIGRQNLSTENIDIGTAAPLFVYSMDWLYKKSQDVIELLDAMYQCRNLHSALRRGTSGSDAERRVCELLPQLSGATLDDLRKNQVYASVEFYRMVRSLVTACFIVISVMNARRKNEVLHRRYGVHAECITIESADLKVFKCKFYVEKTLRDYDEFYVNESTFLAIDTLSKIQNTVRKHRPEARPLDPTEDTLFRYPRITRDGVLGGQDWFMFASKSPAVSDYVQRALGGTNSFRITPHMFRRFYAVLFMYRYEDASLQALSQDLGHFDMEMTRQYVLDTVNTPRSKRIPPEYRVRMLAHERYHSDLDVEIREVGKEKLLEAVGAILGGKKFSGGFEKLIRRIHNKLASQAAYRMSNEERQTKLLTKRLLERGHEPRPFVHGECMAGSVVGRGMGRCRSEVTGELDQSRARPSLCQKCAYHHVSEGYLQSIRVLVSELESEMLQLNPMTLRGKALQEELEQANSTLMYHAKRMAVTP